MGFLDRGNSWLFRNGGYFRSVIFRAIFVLFTFSGFNQISCVTYNISSAIFVFFTFFGSRRLVSPRLRIVHSPRRCLLKPTAGACLSW